MMFDIRNIIIAVLVVLLAVSVLAGLTSTGATLTADEAGKKAVAFVNTNLVQAGDAKLVNVREDNGIYRLTLDVGGASYISYITKDGDLFFPQTINISQQSAPAEPAKFDAPDADKPKVELFVMSFCPYGSLAEGLMKPVAELLGDKIGFNIRFIAHVSGNTSDSLHGPDEAAEDQRQLCIVKEYDVDKWWGYVTEVNSKCALDTINDCWKTAAAASGVDVAKIASCVSKEGLALLAADEKLVEQYGVSGSPTLMINGEQFAGSRTSDAYKEGICTGFATEPSECGQELSSQEQAASSECG